MEENNVVQVNIPMFEGPLDLLLHLVTKNRIDIHDIPIHLITDQYIAYLEEAEKFNIELGSSFFTMASTLLLIKSRMLLPQRRQEEADDSEDPRQELSRSLEEFKRMKEVRARIEELMEEQRPYHEKEPEVIKSGYYRGKISMLRLQAAFFSLYDSLHTKEDSLVDREEVSLDGEMASWEATLGQGQVISFTRFLRGKKTKLRVAVSFLALLELIRIGKVILFESVEGLMVKGEGA